MSKIIDDYLPYTDKFGLIQPEKNQNPSLPAGTSGNGLLYSAQAIVAWEENGVLDAQTKEMWRNVYSRCEYKLGLMLKAPQGKTDQEGPDDYFGAILASAYVDEGELAMHMLYRAEITCNKFDPSKESQEDMNLLGMSIPKRIISNVLFKILMLLSGNRGIKKIFNNENSEYFTLSSWFGRFPNLIGHMKIAAGEQPNNLSMLERAAVVVSLVMPRKKSNHDSWVLAWCVAKTIIKKDYQGLPEKLAARFFLYMLKRTWSSMGDVLAAYFRNEEHPNAVWLKKS